MKTSKLAKVQKKLGCAGSSLGSFSETGRVFDPELIKKVAATLGKQVKPFQDVGKGHVRKKLVAVDGTVIRTLKSITVAAYLSDKNGESYSAWFLHTQFEIDANVPIRIDVTPGSNSGKTDEKTMLRKNLKPEFCYVIDRWDAQFTLFNDIVGVGSSYICRIRDNSDLTAVAEERSVTKVAAEEGVLRDIVVDLGLNCKRPIGLTTRCVSFWSRRRRTPNGAVARARRRARPATASSGSRRTCWTFRPR